MKQPVTKRTLTCLIGGILIGMTTDALAGTVTSSATEPVTGHAPTLNAGDIKYNDVNGNGVLDTGDTVEIDTAHDFVFTDVDGDTEIDRTYSWKVDGTEVATTKTYTIKTEDLGKTIELDVTPHTDATVTAPADGTAVTSTHDGGQVGGLPIAGGTDVITVTISGGSGVADTPVVGDMLAATPGCVNGSCPANLTYKWQVEDGVGSGNYTDITGATNATWQVTTATQKRKIRVQVSN
ncbi:ZirU family protein [Salmonella enterica]|uniref:ZirU family protein n=1 Tax=Salmonella enterica TaxID=28901 RepID=UPI000FBA1CEB|nr:hypothetical protein [Salmonella enterica subsp. enterica serovar Napoli]MLQ56557.1 hypothetical protein [Salmonella enterica subsp. enterica serovar Napoli]